MFRRGFCAALLAVLAAAGASGQGNDAAKAKAEADLKAVRAQIDAIAEQVKRDTVDKNKLTRDLRAAEVSVSGARGELARLKREREERAERRTALAQQRADRQRALEAEQSALAAELRAAYIIGREEPLKLLLNQQDPARAGRMFAYYSYFGRARADRIARIEARVAEIEALDALLADEETELLALEAAQDTELERLDAARGERSKALKALTAQSRSRAATLEQLRAQQAGLEKLIRELKKTLDRFPVDSKDAFAKLRGKLAWPAAGKLVARFGQSRAGAIKWDGVLLTTERGTPVRAVYHGRVAYADWLPGLGLLLIVDHGQGYLSLYGHNDQLFKAVGEKVMAGDTIAAVGDSGGRSRPELYFEIRRAGRPVDPVPWFRQPVPPP